MASVLVLVGVMVGCCAITVLSSDIETRIGHLEALASTVQLAVRHNADKLDVTNTLLQHVVESVTQQRDKETRVANPNVGFDARQFLHHVHNLHLHDKQTVVFNHVNVNRGGGYNATTGRFTCPQHGIYQFATTIPSSSGNTIDCELVMSGNQVGRLHGNTPGLDQATQVVVLECNVGQQVWVRHLHAAHDNALLPKVDNRPSFSGHLISVL